MFTLSFPLNNILRIVSPLKSVSIQVHLSGIIVNFGNLNIEVFRGNLYVVKIVLFYFNVIV